MYFEGGLPLVTIQLSEDLDADFVEARYDHTSRTICVLSQTGSLIYGRRFSTKWSTRQFGRMGTARASELNSSASRKLVIRMRSSRYGGWWATRCGTTGGPVKKAADGSATERSARPEGAV